MTPVRETGLGVFEAIEGNPIVSSLHADAAQRHTRRCPRC